MSSFLSGESADPEDSNSDVENVSSQKILQLLEDAWLNEKFSPELLKHQADYVECMMDQVSEMDSNLSSLRKTDLRAEVHLMEVNRIRYIIASYLRKRLEKIEQFTYHILQQEEGRSADESYLCDEEKLFAQQYLSANENLFSNLLLRQLPHHFQDFKPSQESLVPNLSSHVFLRANKDVPGVVIEGDGDNRDEEIDLDCNSQHILQYKSVEKLVKNGSVQLI